MGNSIQDYRAEIGLYNGSLRFFKTKPSTCVSRKSKYIKTKPNFPLLAAALLIFLAASCIMDISSPLRSEFNTKSFYKNNYTARILTRDYLTISKSADIEDYNFLARYTHGNIKGSGLKLCH